MTYPRTVRYSTLVRFIFPVALVSLLVVIFAVVVIDLVFTMSLGLNGRCEPQLMPAASTEEQIKTLMLAKQVLEANAHQYRADKSREISETTKFQRKENDKLNKKVHELLLQRRKEMSTSEKNALENELTVNRELFDYLVASLRDTPYPGVDNYTRYTVARLGLAPLVGVEPLIPEFGPVINDVLSFQYPISVPPCQDRVITGGRTVFVAVISTAENSDKRKLIRQKWKSNLKEVHEEGLLVVGGFAFVLGQTEDQETQSSIEEEAKTNEDIIQIDIPDIDENLPLKRIAVLNWVNNQCGEIDFVVKVDDNVDVNVLNLAQFVHSHHHHNSNKSVFGVGKYSLGRLDRANFSTDEKWKLSAEEWPWKQYPPHILGEMMVLITGNSIRPLLAACQTTPLMPVENVYFYGICTKKAGIQNHNYTGPSLIQ